MQATILDFSDCTTAGMATKKQLGSKKWPVLPHNGHLQSDNAAVRASVRFWERG
jgi:hypothetical protein